MHVFKATALLSTCYSKARALIIKISDTKIFKYLFTFFFHDGFLVFHFLRTREKSARIFFKTTKYLHSFFVTTPIDRRYVALGSNRSKYSFVVPAQGCGTIAVDGTQSNILIFQSDPIVQVYIHNI